MDWFSLAWRGRARRALLALAMPLSALLIEPVIGWQTDAVAQTPAAEQKVAIRGNRRIEAETILSYMNLKPGQRVTAEDLNRAVRRLFDTGLFKDVRIIPTEDSLVVQVVENPSINVIAFEGNGALKDEDLQQIISLRSRLPFTVSAAEADAQAIIEVYRRTGRFGAEVEPVIIERSDNRVDLVFEIKEGALTEVERIDFVGNEAFSDSRLRGVIETSEAGFFSQFFSSDVYDPDRLELDKELVRAYYFERGYADFTVLSATAELAPDRQGFFITFSVSEGEQYTFGEVTADIAARGLDSEPILAALPSDLTGETFDATLVEEIANELTDLAGQQGFAFVQVRPRPRKNSEDRVIDVVFNVVQGPKIFIERIEIEGNSRTLDRVIRRNIDLVEGDAFDSRKIRLARSRIRALGYFERVELERAEGSAADRTILRVKVQERSTGSLTFGAGFSTSVGPIGSVSLTERNFLGRGQSVKAQINAAGDRQIYDFEFIEPAFLDRDLAIGIRAFFIDEDLSEESSFEIVRLGLAPFVTFPLSDDTRLQLRYEGRRDGVSVDPFASEIIQRDHGSTVSSILGYTLTHDKRDDPVEPRQGYFLTLRQDFAGAGGDAFYANTLARAKGWTSFLGGDVVTSLEFEAGGIVSFSDDIKVNERYFIGGDSLRGFASEGAGPHDVLTRDSLGGNYLLATRLEVTFPLGLPDEFGVFGGFFIDAGTVFGLDGSLIGAPGGANPGTVLATDELDFRVAAGALLFVSTPFGPLEMSFGFPIIKDDLDETELFRLQVGTRF